MTEDKPFPPWSEADERSVVEEMIRDQGSKYWKDVNEFVQQRVHTKAKNIPSNYHEEIIQDVLYKVAQGLPGFQFRSALKSWLTTIITHFIINHYRILQKGKKFTVPLEKPPDDDEQKDKKIPGGEVESAEEIFFVKEDLRITCALVEEYINTHTKPIRNRQIIRMVMEEGRSHEETAKAVGCNPPVVGYVVREVKKYVRERMNHKQQ